MRVITLKVDPSDARLTASAEDLQTLADAGCPPDLDALPADADDPTSLPAGYFHDTIPSLWEACEAQGWALRIEPTPAAEPGT